MLFSGMDWLLIINLLIYLCFFTASVAHILFTITISKLYDSTMVSFQRSDLCKMQQTEGETVRYSVWNALNEYNKWSKTICVPLIVISIGLLLIFLGMLFLNKPYFNYQQQFDTNLDIIKDTIQNSMDSGVTKATKTLVASISAAFRSYYGIIFILLIFLFVDLILILSLPNDKSIKDANDKYNSNKTKIVNAIKLINIVYPIYREGEKTDDTAYPDSVKKLYDIILKRWALSSDSDITLEDSRNTIIQRMNNEDYDFIFKLMKFDSTLKDGEYLKDSYNDADDADNYTKAVDTYKKEGKTVEKISVGKLSNAIEDINYYKPDYNYIKFATIVKRYYIYAYIVLFLFTMPIFHIIYKVFGAVSIGIMVVLMAIFVAYIQFTI